MPRKKITDIEIVEDERGHKAVMRTYEDGTTERLPIVPTERKPRRHILGVRKVTINKTRQKSF